MTTVLISQATPLILSLRWTLITLPLLTSTQTNIPVVLQGVRSCHLLHVTAEHVHPISSEGALRLGPVCSHPAGLSGGKKQNSEVKKAITDRCIHAFTICDS